MSSPAAVPATPSARPFLFVVVILLLAEVVSAFETTMVYNALPALIVAFETNASDASWAITAFLLVAAASAAICGRLGDIYGRRRLLIIVLSASAIGSILSTVTGTLTGLIVGRAIQGVAGAIMPLCFGLAREVLPPRRVPVAVATIAGGALIAGASGNLISGVLIDTLGWHYIFVFAALLALLAAAALMLLRPSTVRATVERIDWIGGVLFAPAIALVLVGVTKSTTWTWLDSRTITCIVIGLALLAAWVWWELRVTSPMINLRLLTHRKLALAMLATAFIASGPIGMTGFLLPLIMQSPTAAPVGLGMTPTSAGALSFGVAILGFLFAPVSGRVAAAAGSRTSVIIGAAFGIVAPLYLMIAHSTILDIVIVSLLLGVSTAFAYTALPNLVVEAVSVENTSEATGVNVVTRTAFQGIATSVGSLILATYLVPGTTFATEGAFDAIFLIMAAACVLTLVTVLFIKRGRSDIEAPAPAPAVTPAEA